MIQFRPYQQQAVNKLLWSQQLEGADLCVLAQGGGKSLIIAELANRLNQDILILVPTQEILKQNLEKLSFYVSEEEIGIYSASFNSKEIKKFTFATIGSIYRKPEFFAHFKTIIIDEADLVPIKSTGSMFMTFLAKIGQPKCYGFTASPYRQEQSYERLENGGIITHTVTRMINRQWDPFWKRIIYNLSTQELINQGYLVPGRYIDKSIISHADIPVNVSRSNFDLEGYEEKIESKKDKIVEAVCLGMELGKHVLVFTSSVKQAEWLQSTFQGSKIITAKTPTKERKHTVESFRRGEVNVLFNVQTMTMGVDFPEIDVIVMLRPTKSIRLWQQMIGRGSRIAPGKKFFYVIDMVGNTKALGKIETIRIEKVEGKWEILSEVGSFHNKPLFSFKLPEAKVDSPIPF
jgi:DNA repair protein RadD